MKRAVFYFVILLSVITTSCTLPVGNYPPVLEPIGSHQVTVGQTLRFPVVAKDLDEDIIQLEVYPERFREYVSPTTWEFCWTPEASDIGQHGVTFYVTDGVGDDTETCTITVSAVVNHAPELKEIEVPGVKEGELVHFMVAASDTDGDILEFAASGELTDYFDPKSRVFYWPTVEGDAGDYEITFMVSDGQDMDSMTVNIIVASDKNIAPVISPVLDIQVQEGESVGPLQLEATDANDDQLTWELVQGPGEIINQTYVWVTTYQDSGQHRVILKVSDNRGGVALCTFWIEVANVNRSPVLGVYLIGGGLAGDIVEFPLNQKTEIYLEATDPDGDSITYSLEDWYAYKENVLVDLSSHFSVDEESLRGIFSWAPIPGDEGYYSLVFKVTDENGGSDLESIVIYVPQL